MGSTTKGMWWGSGSNIEANTDNALGKVHIQRALKVTVLVHFDCRPD